MQVKFTKNCHTKHLIATFAKPLLAVVLFTMDQNLITFPISFLVSPFVEMFGKDNVLKSLEM